MRQDVDPRPRLPLSPLAAGSANAPGGRANTGPAPSDVSVRLDIGPAGIGVELAAPFRLGCVTVVELVSSLAGMRFPVDVTGGVARFRHRRGLLQRVRLEVAARDVERWSEPRLAGILGARSARMWLGMRSQGATVCVEFRTDSDEDRQGAAIVAFELEVLAEGEDLVIVVHDERGIDLPRSAIGVALECADTLLSPLATRSGSTFKILRGAGAIARHVLPRAGARAPAVRDVRWTSITTSGDAWTLVARAGAATETPSAGSIRARELASLLSDADDALFEGDDAAARDQLLVALERMPRHPAIVARIADIDARAGARAEAALSLLNESRNAASANRGGDDLLHGRLLAETGDVPRAVASLARFAAEERAPALSARAASLAASLCSDPEEAGQHLDEALAREPRSLAARWLRVANRLRMGRSAEALADVEHLDAAARGKSAKHAIWMRAGGMWRSAGLGASAGEIFEWALRYVPDDPTALAGLGRALVDASRPGDGRDRRGIALLSRALTVSERRASPSGVLRVDLARCLAERLGDLPTAIAHVSRVASTADEAGVARGLEGRWRAQLGDPVGAGLAFERLREHAEALAPLDGADARGREVVGFLVEGAEHFERKLHDVRSAHRFLEVALEHEPTDPDLRAKYRDFGERRLAVVEPAAIQAPEPPTEVDDAGASARAEDLTQRLRADPSQDATADELAILLERLGRSHELLALMFARLEDAPEEKRPERLARARETFERLARKADVEDHEEEASLIRSALAALPSSL